MAKVFNRKNVTIGKEKKTSAERENLIWREDYGVSKKCVLYPKIPSKLKDKPLKQYTMEQYITNKRHNNNITCFTTYIGD